MKLSSIVLALLLVSAAVVVAAEADPPTRILVAFHSQTGNTEASRR